MSKDQIQSNKWLSKAWLQDCVNQFDKQPFWIRFFYDAELKAQISRLKELLNYKTEEPEKVFDAIKDYLANPNNQTWRFWSFNFRQKFWGLLAPCYNEFYNIREEFYDASCKKAELLAYTKELNSETNKIFFENEGIMAALERPLERIKNQLNDFERRFNYYDDMPIRNEIENWYVEIKNLKNMKDESEKLKAEYKVEYQEEQKRLVELDVFCKGITSKYTPGFLSSPASKALITAIKFCGPNNTLDVKNKIKEYINDPDNRNRRLYRILQLSCFNHIKDIKDLAGSPSEIDIEQALEEKRDEVARSRNERDKLIKRIDEFEKDKIVLTLTKCENLFRKIIDVMKEKIDAIPGIGEENGAMYSTKLACFLREELTPFQVVDLSERRYQESKDFIINECDQKAQSEFIKLEVLLLKRNRLLKDNPEMVRSLQRQDSNAIVKTDEELQVGIIEEEEYHQDVENRASAAGGSAIISQNKY